MEFSIAIIITLYMYIVLTFTKLINNCIHFQEFATKVNY